MAGPNAGQTASSEARGALTAGTGQQPEGLIDRDGFVRKDRAVRCGECSYELGGISAKGVCPECGVMVQRSLGIASELDQAGMVPVNSTRLCISCGYALRGLPGAGMCPECGTAVALSLRERRLHNCSLEYIKQVRTGLSLVLNGILLTVGLFIGGIGLGFAISTGVLAFALPWGVVTPGVIEAGAGLIGLGVSVMIAMGYLRIATRDPSEVESSSTKRSREILRIAVIVQLILAGMSFVATLMPVVFGGFGISLQLMETVGQLIWMGAVLVQVICMMRYTRWLGSRVPDAWIVRRTKVYVWLLPVIAIAGCIMLGLGPLIALILYWNLLDRLRKHLKAIEAGGTHMALKGTGIG